MVVWLLVRSGVDCGLVVSSSWRFHGGDGGWVVDSSWSQATLYSFRRRLEAFRILLEPC